MYEFLFILGIVLFLLFFGWLINGKPQQDSKAFKEGFQLKLYKLHSGMNEKEIKELFGKPWKITEPLYFKGEFGVRFKKYFYHYSIFGGYHFGSMRDYMVNQEYKFVIVFKNGLIKALLNGNDLSDYYDSENLIREFK